MKKNFVVIFSVMFLCGHLFAIVTFVVSAFTVIPWSRNQEYSLDNVCWWLQWAAIASPMAFVLCFAHPKFSFKLEQYEILDKYSPFVKALARLTNKLAAFVSHWQLKANSWYEKKYTTTFRVWYASLNVVIAVVGLAGIYVMAERRVTEWVFLVSVVCFVFFALMVVIRHLVGNDFDHEPALTTESAAATQVVPPPKPVEVTTSVATADHVTKTESESLMKTTALLMGNKWVMTGLGIIYFGTTFVWAYIFGITAVWVILLMSVVTFALVMTYALSQWKSENRFFFLSTAAASAVGIASAVACLMYRNEIIGAVPLHIASMGFALIGAGVFAAGVVNQSTFDQRKILRIPASA